MRRIWSPWRMQYIQNSEPSTECVFCKVISDQDDEKNLVLFRGENAIVMLNRYPYTSGHLMVIPMVHESSYEALNADVLQKIMVLVSHATQVLRNVYHPDGFNMGVNIGTAAGAGIAEHVHFHIVPRWFGDNNFMTATADTRVLPERLEDTFVRLNAVWKQIKG